MKDEIVSDGTVWGSEEWYENRWNSLSDHQKSLIVEHLRKIKNIKEVDEAIDEPFFHFSGGMGVRNYLREIIKDDELPFAPYPNGQSYQNWDDFYQRAIKEAASDS